MTMTPTTEQRELLDVPYDNALNEAGWTFIEAMPRESLTGRGFNNVKPALKAAIECWLKARAAAAIAKGEK